MRCRENHNRDIFGEELLVLRAIGGGVAPCRVVYQDHSMMLHNSRWHGGPNRRIYQQHGQCLIGLPARAHLHYIFQVFAENADNRPVSCVQNRLDQLFL